MRARIENAVETIRSSYWFVPTVMTAAAIGLAAFMVWLDVRTGGAWLEQHLGWYQSIKPSGARDVLATIAGATLTVAGTAFSITIAAISFASGQFGPRLLTNFMDDRGNTFTLGTFVATFVYCLFVLRTVREGSDGGFVPQLAVAVGMLLALCSVAMLIYFIHHVPRAIHISNVIAGIGRQLIAGISDRFPSRIGTPASGRYVAQAPELPSDPPARVCSRVTGYIQTLEEDDLLRQAERKELLLRLHYRPGDFVISGRPLLDVWPSEKLDDDLCASLRHTVVVGDERTPVGDLRFLINELVEIAGRALSSGVNDPMTAVSCMDWLGAALAELAGRSIPDPNRSGKDGKVRIIALPDRFNTFVDHSLGRLHQYTSRDVIAGTHALQTIGAVSASCRTMEQIGALDLERQRFMRLARDQLSGPALEAIERRNEQLKKLLSRGPSAIEESDADWLGGSA